MRPIVSLASLLLALSLPAALPGAPVLLTFEELAPGSAVLSQFAAQGITFNRPTCIDYGLQIGQPTGFAHSGRKGIEPCFAQEFCTVPVEMTFTAPQRRVKAWIGYANPSTFNFDIHLRAFDGSGGLVAESSIRLPPRASPTPIQTPIEVMVAPAAILRAVISATIDGQPASYFAVDDIEYDTEGPPPVCNASSAPSVSWIQPANNAVSRIGSYLFEVSYTTEEQLTAATLTVTGAGGSYTSDLISINSFPITGGRFGPIRSSPLFPGANQLVLRIANCRGERTLQRTVTYNEIPAGTRFVLDRFEVTQTVQDLDHNVPLISGKRTIARAYLRTNVSVVPALTTISGVLTATRPDGSFPGGPTTIVSLAPITLGSDSAIGPRRLSASATLNFDLPPEWTSEGELHLRLNRINVDGVPSSILCDGCENRTQFNNPRLVSFEEAPPIDVVLWSVGYTVAGVTNDPRLLDFQLMESWLRRVYPTGRVQVARRFLSPLRGTPDVDFSCRTVNRILKQMRTFCFAVNGIPVCVDTVGSQIKWYGMVSDTVAFMRGCSDGIPARVASGPAGPGSFGWDTDGSYGDWYGGHELAHTYGRKHPGFCGESDDDDDYPYTGGGIGLFGFDVGDSLLGVPMQANPATQWKDVMTYCDFQWISDYTYEAILAKNRDISGDGGGAGAAILDQALLVQGEIRPSTDAVTLAPCLRLSNIPESLEPPASPYAVELRGAGDVLLERRLFEPVLDTEAVEGEDPLATFDVVLPWTAATRRVVIVKGASVIASRAVSTNPPTVQLLAPNGPLVPPGTDLTVEWTGSDADGDPLVYTLLYSTDGGAQWEPLDAGLTVTQVDIPLGSLRGGNAALFRVLASDGVHTASDDGDFPMVIPNRSPTVRILSPVDGTIVSSDQAVILECEAYDVEDGPLSDGSIAWSSDVVRSFGSGAKVTVSGLSPGVHVIHVEATDSGGAVGSDFVEIEVTPILAVAVAEAPSRATPGSMVTLDGSESIGNGRIEYLWTLVTKPDGATASILDEEAAMARFTAATLGSYGIELSIEDGAGSASTAHVFIEVTESTVFLRGDVTSDQEIDISDPVRILGWLFLGDETPGCLAAANANNDATIDLSDAVAILGYLFLGSTPPAAPFPDCGIDPAGGEIGCEETNCP